MVLEQTNTHTSLGILRRWQLQRWHKWHFQHCTIICTLSHWHSACDRLPKLGSLSYRLNWLLDSNREAHRLAILFGLLQHQQSQWPVWRERQRKVSVLGSLVYQTSLVAWQSIDLRGQDTRRMARTCPAKSAVKADVVGTFTAPSSTDLTGPVDRAYLCCLQHQL